MTRRTPPLASSLASRLALATVLLPTLAFAAPPIGYAQATNYYKRESRPTLYQPLHVLDAREVTAWCSSTGDPLEDALFFGFKGTVTIDEVRVYTGNGFDADTFGQFNRARKLGLETGQGGRTFSVGDKRGLQAVTLNPPLTGTDFKLNVLDVFTADDPDSPVCITDIVFYSDGKPLNGAWLTSKLKYDKGRAPLLGTWFGGYEGAPDQFLSFYFDGTYRFLHSPFDPKLKARAYGGDFDVSGKRLTLSLPKVGKASTELRREGKEFEATTLELEGGQLPPELKQKFRAKP